MCAFWFSAYRSFPRISQTSYNNFPDNFLRIFLTLSPSMGSHFFFISQLLTWQGSWSRKFSTRDFDRVSDISQNSIIVVWCRHFDFPDLPITMRSDKEEMRHTYKNIQKIIFTYCSSLESRFITGGRYNQWNQKCYHSNNIIDVLWCFPILTKKMIGSSVEPCRDL